MGTHDAFYPIAHETKAYKRLIYLQTAYIAAGIHPTTYVQHRSFVCSHNYRVGDRC